MNQGPASPSMSPSQLDAMRAKDRQNATILIHELLEHTVSNSIDTFPTLGEISYVQAPHNE